MYNLLLLLVQAYIDIISMFKDSETPGRGIVMIQNITMAVYIRYEYITDGES